MNVTHLAIAHDGSNVIYIIEDGKIRKSTNSGADFINLSTPAGFILPACMITVAPDNSEIVMAVDSRPGGSKIWLSTNGGNVWNDLGTPKNGINAVITGIAVSPAAGSPPVRQYFATIADNRPGVTTRGDVMMKTGAFWNGIGGVSTTHDYMAVCISPEYLADESVFVVGVTPGKGVDFQIIRSGSKTVTQTVKFVEDGVTDFCVPPSPTAIIRADICAGVDASPGGDMKKVAFVSFLSSMLNRPDGIYRIFDQFFERLTVHPSDAGLRIRSIDFDGEGLLAGEIETAGIWVCSNPLNPSPVWDNVTPPGGEKEAVVGIKTPDCYVGTSGKRGGFFIL